MKSECNLENKGSQTLVVYENWKSWQRGCCLMQSFSLGWQQPFITLALGTSFAGPAAVTNCSAVLQNCLHDQTKHFHWWPKPEFVPPWRGRPCVLTPSTACHCLCQQPALWTAAGVQKAKGKCLRFALVLSHSKSLEHVQVHGKLQAVCRTACTVDFKWNVNHLSPTLF